MKSAIFLQRVILSNYKSISSCDIKLSALTYLVGANGAGKSNFLDALHLVRDALSSSLDNAMNERGGLVAVRRRSNGHPTHFSIDLQFLLPTGDECRYAFSVGALSSGGYEVRKERCNIGGKGKGPFFALEKGKLIETSEETFPAVTSDRLALVSASGLAAFRPAFDALTAMGFYNLNPKVIRDLQKPQDGRLLKPAGENIAGVIGHLARTNPAAIKIIEEYLHAVVPSIHGVEREPVGPMESLVFHQEVSGAEHRWRFPAQNMSDGTLRALGILTALFQGNSDFSPSLIGIEEPETALHPGASAALREALERASEHTQIIVTSHSPDLLDDMKITPEELLIVVSDAGVTRIVPLGKGSKEAMRSHLCSAGELLRLNQLQPEPLPVVIPAKNQAELFEEKND